MGTRWTRQTRRVLALLAVAWVLAMGGVFGPVAYEQATGDAVVAAVDACGNQGGGC